MNNIFFESSMLYWWIIWQKWTYCNNLENYCKRVMVYFFYLVLYWAIEQFHIAFEIYWFCQISIDSINSEVRKKNWNHSQSDTFKNFEMYDLWPSFSFHILHTFSSSQYIHSWVGLFEGDKVCWWREGSVESPQFAITRIG